MLLNNAREFFRAHFSVPLTSCAQGRGETRFPHASFLDPPDTQIWNREQMSFVVLEKDDFKRSAKVVSKTCSEERHPKREDKMLLSTANSKDTSHPWTL